MPRISSQDHAIGLLRDLDQVTQIPHAQRLEVLQSLISFARQIRSLPLPGDLRGRLGVHTMNAIFTIAEHDPASARALRALAARVVDERELGVAKPGISSSMPWPNPLDVHSTTTDVRRDDPTPSADGTDPRDDDTQRRLGDEQRRTMLDEQRRAMQDEQRRRMLEDSRRRMFEDEERRRRDAERYR